jgi:hypothetical protein
VNISRSGECNSVDQDNERAGRGEGSGRNKDWKGKGVKKIQKGSTIRKIK